MPIAGYTSVKVFSVTHYEEREKLGETVTFWLATNEQLEVVTMEVRQSSDNRRHCVSVILFLRLKT